MVERKTIGEKIFDISICTIVVLISIACLYPLLYVVFASFSDPVQLVRHTGPLFKPAGFSVVGYEVMLQNANIGIGYANTIFYVVVGTVLKLLATIVAAYALMIDGFKLKKVITFFIVFTMYVNGGMIPRYLLMKELGLLETRAVILIPGLIATWNLIVMRTAFKAVPAALLESAKIDGANDFIVLFRIVVPVAKATIAVMVLFYAVGLWNSWFDAMIYLSQSRDKWPLQLFLREIILLNTSSQEGEILGPDSFNYIDQVMKYSVIVISTVPILCVYPFIQKYFNKGVVMGSLKG